MSSMNVETIEGTVNERSSGGDQPYPTGRRGVKWGLLLICITFMGIGMIGGPVLQRLYFLHGGNRKWLSSCLQTIGFPIMFLPLLVLHWKNLRLGKSKPFIIKPKLFMAGAFLGLFLGFDNYMYSVGLDYIPVSTSSLLFSTQLAFTAIFAFLIVKQKFTYYSINSVALMTLSAIVLALHTSSDRPPGVTNAHYFLGFFFTLGGAALLGLILPSIEFCYVKAGQEVTYTVVMQFQVVFSVSATVFCIVGMVINNDFQAISREGREYGLGEEKYYVVLVSSAIVWQFLSIGTLGVVYCSSSLFAGIVSVVLLPFTQVAAVIAFNEKFTGEKGMSLALCPWGFTSYFVGEYKRSKKMGPFPITESEQVVNHGNV